MKKLLATLVAGLFATVAYTALAADPVKSGPVEKPGRAADDSTAVKSGGAATATKPGRAADDQTTTPKKKTKKKKTTEPKAQ